MQRCCTFLIVLFEIVLYVSAQQEYCNIDCSTQSPGDFVPDPYDCHRYYGCQEDGTPTDTALECPPGEYFNPDLSRCDQESTPCQRPCPRPSCPLTCHGSISTIANPQNCSQFFVCEPDGSVLLQDCSASLPYFDGESCVSEPQMCCDPCTVECKFPGTELVDPYNCNAYYFCASDGELYEADCGENSNFNAILGQCVDGSNCDDVCRNSTWQTTTTSELTTWGSTSSELTTWRSTSSEQTTPEERTSSTTPTPTIPSSTPWYYSTFG